MPKLLHNTDELKAAYGAIDANFTWSNIESAVNDAETDHIEKTIGPEELTTIAGDATGDRAKAKELLVKACAHLSIYIWSQTALYRLNDASLSVAKDSGGVIISDKKLRDFRNYSHDKAFGYLDEAVFLMESRLADFPAYADSKERMDIRWTFIPTAIDFKRMVRSNLTRPALLSYLPVMQDAENQHLPLVMTPAYYEIFKERYLDGELSPAELKLLPMVQKASAHLTLCRVYEDPTVTGDDGTMVSRLGNSIDYEQRDPASAQLLAQLAGRQQENAEAALRMVKMYLQRNASDYPDYNPPVRASVEVNSKCSGLFIL
ncbi:MAG: hypothetical protein INR69_17415 [Mucilaginibacter polytrichastri]|nr:hypothetical protein [Mucilaginibacter polytrichastri]